MTWNNEQMRLSVFAPQINTAPAPSGSPVSTRVRMRTSNAVDPVMQAATRSKRPAPGRPTLAAAQELTRHMLDVACAQFIALGLEGASIERIALEAGVSKLTLYRHFESKRGLFVAVIEQMVASYAQKLSGKIDTDRAPRQVLYDMGIFLADSYFTPESQGLTRILIGEQQRVPDLSQLARRMGSLVRGPVEHYLTLLQSQRKAEIDDIGRAAIQFVNLCMLGQYYLLCEPSQSIPPPRVRAKIVRSAVNIFSAGYLIDEASS